MSHFEAMDDAPYELAIYRQRFGGRLPSSKVGFMEYTEMDKRELESFEEGELLPALRLLIAKYKDKL